MSPATKRGRTLDLDVIARCEALKLVHAAQSLSELLEEASRDDLTPMHFLAGAWALTGLLESLLFEVGSRDVGTFVVVPLLLAGVALLACWIPAMRATRVDPVTVLREE